MKAAIDKNESELDKMKREALEWINLRGKTAPPFISVAVNAFPSQPSDVSDEKTTLLIFAEYWNNTTDKDNVSYIYDSAIERFININTKYRSSLTEKLIKSGKIKKGE